MQQKKSNKNVTVRNFEVITEKLRKKHNIDSMKGYVRFVWSSLFYWYTKEI
jgi:hypothetical protein